MKQILIPFLFIALFFGCNAQNKPVQTDGQETQQTPTKNEETKSMPDIKVGPNQQLVAVIKTNKGTFEIKLFPDKTPTTVENFVGLAEKGYYNGIIFHRVIDKFMIQGGDPTGTGMGGESFWGSKFEDEFSPELQFTKEGILAMANSGPGTNGSQFFITLAPTPWLNNHHSIFGEVIKGMDIVRAIGKAKTGAQDKPVDKIVMETVTIEKRDIK